MAEIYYDRNPLFFLKYWKQDGLCSPPVCSSLLSWNHGMVMSCSKKVLHAVARLSGPYLFFIPHWVD